MARIPTRLASYLTPEQQFKLVVSLSNLLVTPSLGVPDHDFAEIQLDIILPTSIHVISFILNFRMR